ncbi:glycosyltransferase [Microbacterium sp. NPDC058062]|uniref:glycosyltransferase n=1 Tax=Microbacterium sp. NPDC058062 TaxID=3346320 RepID=UPI0036DA01E3
MTYTYTNRDRARVDLPNQPVWVAANALYPRQVLVESASETRDRQDAIYVGRFEPKKKVHLALRAFAESGLHRFGARLVMIGGGSGERELRDLADELQIGEHVAFPGWIDSAQALADRYATTFVSVSPGFAGLGLTQSLGFGVPMIVAQNEPHSPEIELAEVGGVDWFDSDSVTSMSEALKRAWARRDQLPLNKVRDYVEGHYSAEMMAQGLLNALADRKDDV